MSASQQEQEESLVGNKRSSGMKKCPTCSRVDYPVLKRRPSCGAILLSGLFCVTGLWPCACVPLFMDELKVIEATCVHCGEVIAEARVVVVDN